MNSTEYRAALTRLNLNQTSAAYAIGVAPRTSRAWACGEAGVPEPVVRLLRAFEWHPELMGRLRKHDVDAPLAVGQTWRGTEGALTITEASFGVFGATFCNAGSGWKMLLTEPNIRAWVKYTKAKLVAGPAEKVCLNAEKGQDAA